MRREGLTGHQRLAEQIKKSFGAYILYTIAAIISPQPASHFGKGACLYVPYNEDGKTRENSAYFFLIGQSFSPGKADLEELLKYVDDGNIVFVSALAVWR